MKKVSWTVLNGLIAAKVRRQRLLIMGMGTAQAREGNIRGYEDGLRDMARLLRDMRLYGIERDLPA